MRRSALGYSETSALEFRRSAITAGADHREARAVRCYCRKNSLFASIFSLFHLVGNSTPNPFWILASSVRD